MPETAGILVDWARAQRQTGPVVLAVAEARVPVDASQSVIDDMLQRAIGQWLRWQKGRGWQLVSDIHVGKPGPALNTKTGKMVLGSQSRKLTGTFEYKGTFANG